jgi:hypothetical protein
LALDLVESGEDSVELGDSVSIRREVGFPEADGKVHFTVWADGVDPEHAQAEAQVDRARALIADIAFDDERLKSLLTTFGATWELAHDYGMGSVSLAQVTEDGVLHWPSGNTS